MKEKMMNKNKQTLHCTEIVAVTISLNLIKAHFYVIDVRMEDKDEFAFSIFLI